MLAIFPVLYNTTNILSMFILYTVVCTPLSTTFILPVPALLSLLVTTSVLSLHVSLNLFCYFILFLDSLYK